MENETKLINFNCPLDTKGKIEWVVANSKNKYRNNTQFLLIAIEELLIKESKIIIKQFNTPPETSKNLTTPNTKVNSNPGGDKLKKDINEIY